MSWSPDKGLTFSDGLVHMEYVAPHSPPLESLGRPSDAAPLAQRLRRQGWGMSLGLHAALLSTLIFLRFDLAPMIPPEPFHWQVSLVEPPPSESREPVSDALVAPSPPPPVSAPKPSETVVEPRTVQRASSYVRTIQPRTSPPVESRVVTRAAPAKQLPVVETAAAVVHSAGEVRRLQTVAQPQTQGAVEAIERTAQAVTVPVSTPRTVARPADKSDDQEGEAAVQDKGLVETTVAPLRHVDPVHDQPVPVETVQVQRVDLKQSEAVVPNVQSVGQVRPHYGWLKADLMAQIERMKRYPQFALDNRLEGRVVVRAVIRADGHLLELSIAESSGHELLDRESLDLLRRLSPVPLKHQLGTPHVTLRIPINYGIR